MNTLRREIFDALEDAPEGLCDSCLQKACGTSSHQTMNNECRKLELEGRLHRGKSGDSECTGCGKHSIINRLVPFAEKSPIGAVEFAPFGIIELDALRRELIQFFNSIDASGSKEGFSKRVTSLRNSQILPATVASLMLTHAAYRNDVYYNSHQLTSDERQILKGIDKFLRAFLVNTRPQKGM